jgi:hypothetical protein
MTVLAKTSSNFTEPNKTKPGLAQSHEAKIYGRGFHRTQNQE